MNLRRNFITGLLVLIPATLAGWVLYNAFSWVDNLLWDRVRFSFVREGGIPGVGFVIVILVVMLTGMITNDYIGGRIVRRWERFMLRIPLFNKIYGATKQVSEAFLNPERRTTVFQSSGMVEYPRKGAFVMGFEVSDAGSIIRDALPEDYRDKEMISVFVPSTPNPTTGFLLFIPRAEYGELPINLEDSFKMIISGGVFMPGEKVAAAAGKPDTADRERRGA